MKGEWLVMRLFIFKLTVIKNLQGLWTKKKDKNLGGLVLLLLIENNCWFPDNLD